MAVPVDRRRRSALRLAFKNLMLMLFGFIIALLVLELFLSIYNPFNWRVKGGHIVLQINKTYRIKNDTIKSLGSEVTVIKNELGFRGADPPTDFGGALTIVTIGGSTTQGFFLNEDETWTARLGQQLEKSFQPLWINNAGLDGHSTRGHLILLEDYIVPLRPKVALFLIGANDVAIGSLSEWEAENIRSGIRFESPKAFIKSVSGYSELVALLLLARRSFTAYQAGLSHQYLDLQAQGYPDVSEEDQRQYVTRYSGQYLQDYELRLRRIVDICRNAGIEPVFITQPLLVGFGTDELTGVDLARVRAHGPQRTGKMYWDLLEVYNDVTRQVGLEKEIPVVDLARELPKTSRYFYDFIHPTPQGSQAIADILYRSLCPVLQTKYPQYTLSTCDH